jgi:glycogen debranching enzyme
MIGVFYGVVPGDRAEKIVESLNKQSLTQWGIAETTPYYPAGWGYEEATYHNGGVWPWLSFMDCWARLKMGRTDEAISLIKRVAKADLTDSGDWSPNEHINSLTGENLGYHIQGWNAGLFGLVFELEGTYLTASIFNSNGRSAVIPAKYKK